MTNQTVEILGCEHDVNDLLSQRSLQLDALGRFCVSSFENVDGSDHDFIIGLMSDLAFEIRLLVEMSLHHQKENRHEN